MKTLTVSLAALALLAGCSSGPEPQVAARKPLPPWPEAPGAKPPARPAPLPLADANEAVWHLRAGLNVAALMCKGRGRASVAGDYSRLLTRHRSLLAAAYAAEQKRQGSGLDRHQTRLYNRYSNQRDPAGFCRDAADVARRAVAMDSPTLARSASSMVGALD
jgi:hypothetical protein